jgi:hypothetical protein
MHGTRFREISVEEGSDSLGTIDNFLVDLRGGGLILHFGDEREVAVPNGIRALLWCAFRWSASLRSLHLPSSVQKLWWGCFVDCDNLSTVTFGLNLRS